MGIRRRDVRIVLGTISTLFAVQHLAAELRRGAPKPNRDRDDSTTDAVAIALAEFQRRTQLVQIAAARVDQSLTLAAAGLTVLTSVAVGVFAALWRDERNQFWTAMGALAAAGAVFMALVLYRDFYARRRITLSENAQTRLCDYLVSREPELQKYLPYRNYDIWPSSLKASGSFKFWIVMTGLIAVQAGIAFACFFRSLRGFVDTWAAVAAICFTLISAGLVLTWLARSIRRAARWDRQRVREPH